MRKNRIAVGVIAITAMGFLSGALRARGHQSSQSETQRSRQISAMIDAARLDPNDASTRLRLGVMLTQNGRIDEAARWLDEAAAIDPSLTADLLLDRRREAPPLLNRSTPFPRQGPDVIVSAIDSVFRWGRAGDITAYSLGTTSCNAGDVNIDWVADTTHHPVIAQTLYRLKEGRIDMIGQSWVKHGFAALPGNFCNSLFGYGCNGVGGAVLGVGCSDPYSSTLNGSYSFLGPKHEIKADTGDFPYPYTSFPANSPIGKRLQVHDADLDPALNAGALYFVEAQYVAADDAAAGNDDNNASCRRVEVAEASPGTGVWLIRLIAELTTPEQAGIDAWQIRTPGASIANIHDPQGGYWRIGSSAKDLGGGLWRYTYAVYNMNSDRSGRSFRVPVGLGATITNIGFHDVDWHSGAPYDLTDWAASIANGAVVWSTDSYAMNPNANALRWGTLYSFWFDADRPPDAATLRVGLFKPGQGDAVAIDAVSPAEGSATCQWDLNVDGVVNVFDLAMMIGSSDRPYKVTRLANLIGSWGVCP